MKSPSKETPLHAMLFGGNQERGFRPGTENTGMIAGLGEAAQLVVDNLKTFSSHMRKVRYRWCSGCFTPPRGAHHPLKLFRYVPQHLKAFPVRQFSWS